VAQATFARAELAVKLGDAARLNAAQQELVEVLASRRQVDNVLPVMRAR